MNGVEILNQTTIYETEMCWWLIGAFAGLGLLEGVMITIYDWIEYGFDKHCILFTFIITAFFAFVGFGFAALTEHKTDTVDYIEYTVTIDDSVSMTDFLDKYEILDQEGKIYTVKERE